MKPRPRRSLLIGIAVLGIVALLVGTGLFFSKSADQPSPPGEANDTPKTQAGGPETASQAPHTVPGTPSLRFEGGGADERVPVFATVGTPGLYPPTEEMVEAGGYLVLPEPQAEIRWDGESVAHEVYARSQDDALAFWADIMTADAADMRPHTVALLPATPIAVEVVDTAGEPVAGAEVRVSRGLIGLIHLSQATDEGGKTRFAAIPEGDFRLTVRAPGFVRRSRHFLHTGGGASDGVDEVRITLDRGATLTGRVIDEAGRGVPGARVEVIPVSPFADEILDADFLAQVGVASQIGAAENDGRFSIGGIAAGAVQVRAEASGYSSGLSKLVRVRRGRAQTVSDIVLRSEVPREELLVRVQTSDPNIRLSSVELRVDENGSSRRCVGRHIRADDWRFSNCGFGPRTLVATTSDGVKLRWKGEFGAATEVVLQAPIRLEIFVVDETGSPIQGALVQLWKGGEKLLEGDSGGAEALVYQAPVPFEGALVALDSQRGAGSETISLKTGAQADARGARRYVITLNRDLLGVSLPPGNITDIAEIAAITGVDVVRDGRQVLFDMVAADSPGGRAGVERGDRLVFLRRLGEGYALVVSRGDARIRMALE